MVDPIFEAEEVATLLYMEENATELSIASTFEAEKLAEELKIDTPKYARRLQYLAQYGLIAPAGIMGNYGFYYLTADGESFVRHLKAEWKRQQEAQLKSVTVTTFQKLAGPVKDMALEVATDLFSAMARGATGLQ